MKPKKGTMPPKKSARPRQKSGLEEIAMVAPEILTLPDTVWQWLGLSPKANNPSLPRTPLQPATFYRHEGHLCLALTHSLAGLRFSTTTNIFSGPGGGHYRASFCAVLGVSDEELQKMSIKTSR
jgi:hypothetical protein